MVAGDSVNVVDPADVGVVNVLGVRVAAAVGIQRGGRAAVMLASPNIGWAHAISDPGGTRSP